MTTVKMIHFKIQEELPKNALCLVTGGPNTGKSTLATDLVLRRRALDGQTRPLVGIGKKIHEITLNSADQQLASIYDAAFPTLNEFALDWIERRSNGFILLIDGDEFESLKDILGEFPERVLNVLGNCKNTDGFIVASLQSANMEASQSQYVDLMLCTKPQDNEQMVNLYAQFFHLFFSHPQAFKDLLLKTTQHPKMPWACLLYLKTDFAPKLAWYKADPSKYKMQTAPACENPVG